MGLFEKKRSVAALGPEAINAIKQELNSILSVAKSYDQVLGNSGMLVISLEGRIRGDLLAFVLYLSGVGKGVDPKEIQTVNQIFDIDLSHVDFALFRKDVGNKSFEEAVPPSILILNEMGKAVQREQFRTRDGEETSFGQTSELSRLFVTGLINVYAMIGSAFISADGKVTERESTDLIRYLLMMTQAMYGKDASLPEGAAQQTIQAHVRLFGKQPRLR